MVVDVTNLTDGPGKTPTQVAIYNVTLEPGATVRLPADLVNAKVKSLEEQGLISIGPLPGWYTKSKSRIGKRLSEEDKAKRIKKPAPLAAKPKKESTVIQLREEIPVEDDLNVMKRKVGK